MLWIVLEDPDAVLIFEADMVYNRESSFSQTAGVVDTHRAALCHVGGVL
ncbi:MAG: pyruvate/2-oxoglutarate/acetoin dehydrogenase E1 component [Paracoccaceae bacterium]|jgi:hypothetical protein|tara:strand:+ start:105 stop:251 length:147 start_codon:yes stop_codon:yes gene_type:complete